MKGIKGKKQGRADIAGRLYMNRGNTALEPETAFSDLRVLSCRAAGESRKRLFRTVYICEDRENRREKVARLEIYQELSAAGKVFCGMAGFLEQILLFLLLGIRIDLTPAVIYVFCWLLLAVITAGTMIELEELRIYYHRRAQTESCRFPFIGKIRQMFGQRPGNQNVES